MHSASCITCTHGGMDLIYPHLPRCLDAIVFGYWCPYVPPTREKAQDVSLEGKEWKRKSLARTSIVEYHCVSSKEETRVIQLTHSSLSHDRLKAIRIYDNKRLWGYHRIAPCMY